MGHLESASGKLSGRLHADGIYLYGRMTAHGRKNFTNFYNCVVELLAIDARGAIVVVHPEYWAVSIKPKQQPILVSNHGGHGAETSPEKGDVAKV